jgi:hypothetical protein
MTTVSKISSTVLFSALLLSSSCKKNKIEPTPVPTPVPAYTVPTTYSFTNSAGQSTIDYSGQTDRLNQLREMVTYMKTGTAAVINAQQLKDMFANTGDNGNGHFTFTSVGKQLKNKCFTLDQALFEKYFDSIAIASTDFAQTAANGSAGTLVTGTSTYLFTKTGLEPLQIIEKGLMGAVFMNQALNEYLGSVKMSVDNTTAVDPANGKYYTALAHHWDEAFGYFGVSTDFPTTLPADFWGKYCNAQNATLGSNAKMMNNLLKGRAAIANNVLADRDAAIAEIRNTWENISAYAAMKYIDDAILNFGVDNAKFLHNVSEAYAFAWDLRYAPEETRNITQTEHGTIMALFGANFWNLTLMDLNAIKSALDAEY